MVGTAVKRFQTGEQVISQSFPLGQHPPHLNTPGEENVPTVQVPAECVHEGKMHLFFSLQEKKPSIFLSFTITIDFLCAKNTPKIPTPK